MIRSTSSAAPVCWCASLSALTAVAKPVTAYASGVSPLSSPAVPMSAPSCVFVPIEPDRWVVYEPT